MRQIFCRHHCPPVPFTFVNHRRRSEKDISLKRHSLYELAVSEIIILIHELSAVLWVHIAVFESTLRSFIHNALSAEYKTTHWWEESSLLTKRDQLDIEHAKQRLEKRNLEVEPEAIISNLSLSFWVELFSKRYHSRIWMTVEKLFHSKPDRRFDFFLKAKCVRDLRNAIAHHAPILHRNLERDLSYIQELISLLSPPLAESLRNRSNVLNLINQLNEIPRVRSH